MAIPTHSSESQEDRLVVTRAQIVIKGDPGLELLKMLGDTDVVVRVAFCADSKEVWRVDLRAQLDGLMEYSILRSALPLTESGTLKAGVWTFDLAPPDCAFVVQAPSFTSATLDFGTIEIEAVAFAEKFGCILTGQFVHVTGVPAANTSEFYLDTDNDSARVLRAPINTDSEGRFVYPYRGQFHEAPHAAWTLRFAAMEVKGVRQPRIDGKIAHFGRIEVDCAVLEFAISGWAPEDANPVHSASVDAEEPVVLCCSFRDKGVQGLDCLLMPGAPRQNLFLPPGSYSYEIEVTNSVGSYDILDGKIDLPAGQVTTLTRQLTPVPTVLVQIECEKSLVIDRDHRLGVAVKYIFGEQEKRVESYALAEPFVRVPRYPGLKIRLVVSAPGWRAVTLDVPDGADSATLRITERSRDTGD
ncbi:MAG: hypothetical protein IT462_17845 [Planctomycetes bacterium]|nr:hypothetical protein [Planctomycetota bacterium]